MNANILYDIYTTTRRHGFKDLVFGLAQYNVDHPEAPIGQEESKTIREFVGRHGQELAEAFPDKEKFAAAVAEAEAQDAEKAEQAQE